MKTITTMILAVAITGCASSHVQLQVNTQPAGAYVTEVSSGSAFGVGPVLVQYPREALTQKDATGCSLVKGFNAQWVSGATATTGPSVRLCGSEELYGITLTRNTSDPGLDKDMEFALRAATAGTAQRQADAVELGAGVLFLNSLKPGR